MIKTRNAPQRLAQTMAAAVYCTEHLCGVALYVCGIALSVLAADGLYIPNVSAISMQRAFVTELFLFAPIYLAARLRGFQLLYWPCCLAVGCITGVLFAVTPQTSLWILGLCICRLFLMISLKNHRNFSKFVIWTAICSVLKYFAC